MQNKVLIATSTFAVTSTAPLRVLEKHNIAYLLNPHQRTLTAEEVIRLARDCTGIISGNEPLDRQVLAELPHLRCISRVGIGLDNIDPDAAQERRIVVKNTPAAPTRAVAELTVAMILDLARGVTAHDREVRKGVWKKRLGIQVGGRNVGVVGLGRIGRLVAEMLTALGARVMGMDMYPDASWAEKHGIVLADLATILRECDIVTLHVPYTKGAPAIIGREEFGLMKQGSFILNLSRGGIVDEAALCEALASGKIAGAAIDTFAKEPYTGPLTGFDNVILTPHMGSNTVESREAMELEAAQNIAGVLAGTNNNI